MKLIIIGTVASSIFGFRMPFIKKLLTEGCEVYAFSIDFSGKQKQTLKSLGVIPIDYTLNRSGLNPINDLKTTFSLYSKIKQINPDVVFSYFTKPVIYGSIAAKLAGVKMVVGMVEGMGYSFTSFESGFTKKRLILREIQSQLFKLSSKFIDRLIVLNEDDKLDLQAMASFKSISVLGGIGVDLDDYSYVEKKESDMNFIFVSRLLKEKGIEYFLEAASIVKNKYPEATFTVLGAVDDANPNSLSDIELNHFKEKSIIQHHGHVSNVKDYLEATSVFVLPSFYREGVPRSTQEAMAIGRAIITTDSVGCKDTTIEGYNGFLVPKWDSGALVEKMIYFINNPKMTSVMGRNSRLLAEKKFNIDDVNLKLWDIINEN